MKEHQWRLFEYNMSKWMIENKYILDSEEKKKFYKCANYSIGSGMINASLIYFFCKKNPKYFSSMSRLFLTCSVGIYTSMVVNKVFRRQAYTEVSHKHILFSYARVNLFLISKFLTNWLSMDTLN